MDEHAFIRSIHRHIPRSVYKLKIAMRFARGVPDAWYSGDQGDLWVEYKYIKPTPSKKRQIGLSANQVKWLNDRFREGRSVAVVIGTPSGNAILTDLMWCNDTWVPTTWLTNKETATWITTTVSTSMQVE